MSLTVDLREDGHDLGCFRGIHVRSSLDGWDQAALIIFSFTTLQVVHSSS